MVGKKATEFGEKLLTSLIARSRSNISTHRSPYRHVSGQPREVNGTRNKQQCTQAETSAHRVPFGLVFAVQIKSENHEQGSSNHAVLESRQMQPIQRPVIEEI